MFCGGQSRRCLQPLRNRQKQFVKKQYKTRVLNEIRIYKIVIVIKETQVDKGLVLYRFLSFLERDGLM